MQLDQLIAGLVSGKIKSPHRQHGGATLHWNSIGRTLSVWRDNEAVKPAECATYEKYIRRAGFNPGTRWTKIRTTDSPSRGDYRYSVHWVLSSVNPAPPAPAADPQIALF